MTSINLLCNLEKEKKKHFYWLLSKNGQTNHLELGQLYAERDLYQWKRRKHRDYIVTTVGISLLFISFRNGGINSQAFIQLQILLAGKAGRMFPLPPVKNARHANSYRRVSISYRFWFSYTYINFALVYHIEIVSFISYKWKINQMNAGLSIIYPCTTWISFVLR